MVRQSTNCYSIDAGGSGESGELLQHCETYDPLLDEWREGKQLPGPRKDHSSVAGADCLFLSGGVSPTQEVNDTVW